MNKFREYLKESKEWSTHQGKNIISYEASKPNASNTITFEIEKSNNKFYLTKITSSNKTGKSSETTLEHGVTSEYMSSAMEYYKLPGISTHELESIGK